MKKFFSGLSNLGKNRKNRKIGLSQIILLYSIGIGLMSVALGLSLYFFASNNINQIITFANANSDTQLAFIKTIKDFSLLQSNTLATLTSKTNDDLDIRIEIINGYVQESEQSLKACGEACSKIEEDFKKYVTGWKSVQERLLKDKKSKEQLSAEFSEKYNSIMDGVFDKIESVILQNTKSVVSRQTELTERTSKHLKFVLIGICIFGLFMGTIGLLLRRVLMNSILDITHSLGINANGTLKLSHAIKDSSTTLSNSSREQTDEISKISVSLQEIASVASSNVSGAELAGQFSKEIYNLSEDTQKSMEFLAHAMDQILLSNQRIEKLALILQEITKKTELIDDIVFKTQILSFNASVEAARAGEHGRGFSVVAEEVGILARKSEASANDISAFVKNSYLEAQSIVQDNKDKVAQGEQLVFETKEKLNNSIAKVNQILDVIERIIHSSKEQENGISHASESVEHIRKHIQNTSMSAEQSAHSGSELSAQSVTVSSLVNDLNTLIKGLDKKQAAHFKEDQAA